MSYVKGHLVIIELILEEMKPSQYFTLETLGLPKVHPKQ
jgi:hypothetical protein